MCQHFHLSGYTGYRCCTLLTSSLRLQIYTEKGFTPAEAHTVMAAMTRKPEYADYFVDHMMVQELGVSRSMQRLSTAGGTVRTLASPAARSAPATELARRLRISHLFVPPPAAAFVHRLTRTRLFSKRPPHSSLQALVPSPDEQPWKDGLVTFASFMIFGFLPILPYIIFWAADYHSASGQLGICAAVSLLALFALGGVQAKIIRQSIVKQGLLMAINGGMAGAAAYAVGLGLQKAFGVQGNPCS